MPDVTSLMALADALVTALAAAELPVDTEYDVQWVDDAAATLEDPELGEKAQVWVIDFAESHLPAWSAAAAQHGCPIDEQDLLVIVQYKPPEGETASEKCREMAVLAGEIARWCRKTPILDATCVQTKRDPARDFKLYHETGLFRAEIITTWHRLAEDG